MAAELPSLWMDFAMMCIMSEGLDIVQILQQPKSEGLDPRLNQVKSDRLDFTRDIQMDLNVSPRWTWVMRWPDFYQMHLIERHTPRRTWVCEPTLVKTVYHSDARRQFLVWLPTRNKETVMPYATFLAWLRTSGIKEPTQSDARCYFPDVIKDKWNKRTNNLK